MSSKVNASAAAPQKKRKKESMWAQVFKRLLKNPSATFGLSVIAILFILAILSPYITRYTYEEMDLLALNASPSLKHLFGTDSLGRDCLSRLLYGGRFSLGLGIISAVASTAVAIVLGSIAGYFGGSVDNLIMRFCDIMQSIPGMLLSIIISATLGVGFVNTVIALTVGGIAGGTRMLRGQILGIRKEEYLEAALTVNCSPVRIMFRHILPNALSATIVGVTMGMGNTIMVAASLSYIGLGVQPPDPEWGAMLSSGRDVFRKYPHIMLFPGIFIFITVLCFNLFGDGLRDAMDPKLKR